MRSMANISAAAARGCFLAVVLDLAVFASPAETERWQTPAKWHRSLKKPVHGTLLLDDDGMEFRSAKFDQRWAFIEIHTFDLSARELTITGYQNRHWREPGEQRFQFTWSVPMPPDIAAQLAEHVGKPVRNGIPLPSAPAMAEIPAQHRVWSGGSDGILRLKESGIDFVTDDGRDGRAWRWADIQTIANPNPYELRVTAYRGIVEFDLKQPLPRALFERIWDYLYAVDLNLSAGRGEEHQ
jgi:hypothetical protein